MYLYLSLSIQIMPDTVTVDSDSLIEFLESHGFSIVIRQENLVAMHKTGLPRYLIIRTGRSCSPRSLKHTFATPESRSIGTETSWPK